MPKECKSSLLGGGQPEQRPVAKHAGVWGMVTEVFCAGWRGGVGCYIREEHVSPAEERALPQGCGKPLEGGGGETGLSCVEGHDLRRVSLEMS